MTPGLWKAGCDDKTQTGKGGGGKMMNFTHELRYLSIVDLEPYFHLILPSEQALIRLVVGDRVAINDLAKERKETPTRTTACLKIAIFKVALGILGADVRLANRGPNKVYLDKIQEQEKMIKNLQAQIKDLISKQALFMCDVEDMPITELGLDKRVANTLARRKVSTLSALQAKTESQLLKLPFCGVKVVSNVKAMLAKRGLELTMDEKR